MPSGPICFDLLPALWHSGTTTKSGLFLFPAARIPAERWEIRGPVTFRCCSCYFKIQNVIILKRLSCAVCPPFEKDLEDGDAQCVALSQVYQFQRSESSDLAVCPGCPITRS